MPKELPFIVERSENSWAIRQFDPDTDRWVEILLISHQEVQRLIEALQDTLLRK